TPTAGADHALRRGRARRLSDPGDLRPGSVRNSERRICRTVSSQLYQPWEGYSISADICDETQRAWMLTVAVSDHGQSPWRTAAQRSRVAVARPRHGAAPGQKMSACGRQIGSVAAAR